MSNDEILKKWEGEYMDRDDVSTAMDEAFNAGIDRAIGVIKNGQPLNNKNNESERIYNYLQVFIDKFESLKKK